MRLISKIVCGFSFLAAFINLPAFGVLDVNLVIADNDTISIVYRNADVANLPRAFALVVSIDGTGVFTGIKGYKTGESTSVSKGFGIYPARINIASDGTVNNYGSPLADSNDAGVTGTGLGTNKVVLEFGSLYFGDVNAPATSGTLCQLDFTKGTATNITLSTEAVYRGGVILEDGETQIAVHADLCIGGCGPDYCLLSTAPYYSAWVDFGKPACWCYKRQCQCDADGIKSGLYWCYTSDLNILKSAYQKQDAALRGIPNGICADFDHTKSGLYRVYTSDLNQFKQYYQKSIVPECPNTYVNFWTN
jgi:hypothetical protein